MSLATSDATFLNIFKSRSKYQFFETIADVIQIAAGEIFFVLEDSRTAGLSAKGSKK
jgi:hypothetical protein